MPSKIVPTTYRLGDAVRIRLNAVARHLGLPSEAAAIRHLTDQAFFKLPPRLREAAFAELTPEEREQVAETMRPLRPRKKNPKKSLQGA